jgi:hypothetical protein
VRDDVPGTGGVGLAACDEDLGAGGVEGVGA